MPVVKTYLHSLDKSSRKLNCPDCGHKTLVVYLNKETDQMIASHVGRCDRENRCGYHYTPAQYFKENGAGPEKQFIEIEQPIQPVQPDYIPDDMLLASFKGFMFSSFAIFLTMLFGKTIAKEMLLRYAVGRSRMHGGKGCIYFRIDKDQHVRTGKIMLHDEQTGKRDKNIAPTWVHVSLKPFNLVQCFFGEHLINSDLTKPIALVESEKTAIIAAIYMPQLIWLATGGKTGVKLREYETYKILKDRRVIMFPDFGNPDKSGKTPYDKWCEIADHIRERIPCNISVSRLLEDKLPAERRSEDLDLADLLLKRDPDIGCAVNDEGLPMILLIDNKALGVDFLKDVEKYKS